MQHMFCDILQQILKSWFNLIEQIHAFFFFSFFFFFSLAPFGCFGYHLLSPCLRRMVTGDREAEWSLPAGCSQRRSCLPVALHKPMPSGALLTCKAVSLTSETGCSLLIAAPLLRQDRWDGFNLIIAADVASEYFFFFFFFLKTFTQPWKVEWAIFLFIYFFQRWPISHFAAQSVSVRRRFSVLKCSAQWDFTRRSIQFQIHFLGYTWGIRGMLNITAVICLL